MALNKKTSIIINTKNEEGDIERLLKSITDQLHKNYEIILVDNNSTDKTKEITNKYTKNIYNKGPERSAQRNYGAKKAQGEYLLFLDADMELPTGLIVECVKIMESNTNCGGIIIPEKSIGDGFWARVKEFERSMYKGDESIESARFYRKNIFRKTQGYDEEIVGFEDLELSNRVRAISEISRCVSTIKHHEGKLTLLGMAKKSAYYAKTSSKLLKKWNKSPLNSQTFYFLRPTYYRNWRKFISHPVLSIGMIIMLTTQLIFGGINYIRYK